jgi:ribose transport system substrate-binding protein
MRLRGIPLVPLILLGILIFGSIVIFFGVRAISPPEPPRVFVIVKTMNPAIAFWQVVLAGIRAAAKEFDLSVSVNGPFDEINVDEQVSMVEEAIQQRPAALVLGATDYNTLVPAVEKAHQQGIKVITFDSDVNSTLPLCFVATDNVEAGRKAGTAMLELVGASSSLIILGHVKGTSTAIDRERGVRQVFDQRKSLAIKGTYFCDNFFEKAYQITKEVITAYPWIDGIVALNEVSTVGAVKAIRDLKLKRKVYLVGFDQSIEEIKAIEDGILDATVVQKPFNMGYIALQKVKEILTGKKIERFIDTGSVLITRETMYHPENQKILFPFAVHEPSESRDNQGIK